MIIPLLLRPRIRSILNRWFFKAGRSKGSGRDLLFLGFLLPVLYLMYRGSCQAAHDIYDSGLSPSVPLEIILFTVFFVLLFSSSIAALSSLFLASDLDLILSAPLRPITIFTSRFADICWSASWIVIIFCLPVFGALITVFRPGGHFILSTILVLFPFVITPSALGVVLAIVFANILSIRKTKDIFIAVALVLIGAAYTLTNSSSNPSGFTVTEIISASSLLSDSGHLVFPALFAARSLGEMLLHQPLSSNPLILQYIAATLSLILAYIVFRVGFERGVSRLSERESRGKIQSQRLYVRDRALLSWMPAPRRAMTLKELKTFFRDISQTVQLLLILIICYMTLYGFKLASKLEAMPQEFHLWWKSFLTVANVGLGSLIIAFVCTRFVFPSVSMEGQMFWIIRSSPMSLLDYLRSKFWFWYVPISIIGAVILVSGAFAADVNIRIVLSCGIASCVITYGIVGLAIGFGARHARFDWEHTSQLAASYGTLLFMAISSLFIVLNLLPLAFIILLRTLRSYNYSFTNWEWYVSVTLSSFILVFTNYITTRESLSRGAKVLQQRTDSN